MLNLDTHILIHMLTGQLTRREGALLRNQPLGISSIVLWEVARLHELGRITIGLDNPAFAAALDEIHVWEITGEICTAMVEQLDLESDPADELIAATSIVHRAPLVTRDAKLRRSQVVPLARV